MCSAWVVQITIKLSNKTLCVSVPAQCPLNCPLCSNQTCTLLETDPLPLSWETVFLALFWLIFPDCWFKLAVVDRFSLILRDLKLANDTAIEPLERLVKGISCTDPDIGDISPSIYWAQRFCTFPRSQSKQITQSKSSNHYIIHVCKIHNS